MQLPEQPPPPLAPLWDRVIRAQALPPDLDVDRLYIAIRDRLVHPEWEVRLHALRVLADLLPLSGNALSFPFDQVVDNLGHSSPNVRKAALDALKVFCSHCEEPECAARAILDKCSYNNIRPQSANIESKTNVITGLILSIPSVMGILKRRHPMLDTFPIIEVLGEMLFHPDHRDVAHRSLLKLRRVCGPRDYMIQLSRLDPKVQDKFRYLCEIYDEDSQDVYYAPRKNNFGENNREIVTINHVFSPITTPIGISTDTSSEDSFSHTKYYNGNSFGKVILETEIKFDSDTAITMTVLEDSETESDRNIVSEDDCDSSDRYMLKYSDLESEDTDVIVKKVRFGGESIKIRTPDSENQVTSEEDTEANRKNNATSAFSTNKNALEEAPKSTRQDIVTKTNENNHESLERRSKIEPKKDIVTKTNENKHESLERGSTIKQPKKSGIPLPVIYSNKPRNTNISTSYTTTVKLKSKSLNELYDYFRFKNDVKNNKFGNEGSGFALTISEARSPEKVPSPVEPHREVEVLHNLQRSPAVSPKRKQTRLRFEQDGFIVNLLTSSAPNLNETSLLSPRPPSPLKDHYDWEDLELVPKHVSDQMHNTENWIAAVKAVDQLHNTLLKEHSLAKVEPEALSLVQHMWALCDAVPASRAPAEGVVCALVRGASNECARRLLPALVARMGRDPCPAALPHALLQRLALHHLVDLVFDPDMIGVRPSEPERLQAAQLRAALCLSRAAGPAAVLAAVSRRLADTPAADHFCNKLRERLSRPAENIRPHHAARSSQSLLPLPVRRRARSTPTCPAPLPPRRLRPLPDSAPLLGNSSATQVSRDRLLKRLLSPIPLSDRDSSGYTSYKEEKKSVERKSLDSVFGDHTHVDIPADDVASTPPTPARSPSIQVEDYSEKTNPSIRSNESRNQPADQVINEFGSQKSLNVATLESPVSSRSRSRKSNRSPVSSKSRSPTISPVKSNSVKSAKSRNLTPEPTSNTYLEKPSVVFERDVRNALSECIVPAKHEDWEVIVNSLVELERLAIDSAARAPAASWRAVVRSASGHVRSLRSRVARAACSTVGALFEHRGRALDPELEDAAQALLERCADVNRFLRADAADALVRIAIGSNSARAAVALSRRGASHRAGPVRAAAAQALAKLVQHNGPSRILDMPTEARTVLLRAAGELLGDASADTRVHARQLCLALAEDNRFYPMLKDAMPPSRYRAIEKFVDKLCCR